MFFISIIQTRIVRNNKTFKKNLVFISICYLPTNNVKVTVKYQSYHLYQFLQTAMQMQRSARLK